MEVTKFKATQEPIKALYGKDAKAAFLTLKARGSASDSTVTCKVETGRGPALAGIHPKAGGTGRELCSGDMLLEALIACAGVSMRAKLQPRIMRCELSAFEWATIERMLPTKPRGVPQPSVSGYVPIKSTS